MNLRIVNNLSNFLKNFSHGFSFISVKIFICILFLFFYVSISSSFAGVYDGSADIYDSNIIRREVSFSFVKKLEAKVESSLGKDRVALKKLNSLTSRTVFWTGRISETQEKGDCFWLVLRSDDGGNFAVLAKKNIRNLDFNRTGYRIGVKGTPLLKGGRFSYLKAKSLILIEPPIEMSYRNFIRKYEIPTYFHIKTPQGVAKFNNAYYPFVLHRIYMHNPHYSWNKIKDIGASIIYYCHIYPTDPLLVTALLNIESAFDVEAVSRSGAVGLGQLMPGTAAGLGVDPADPVQNVGGAVKYLNSMLNKWRNSKNQVHLALASYNAGPGAVSRCGGVPAYSETRNYVFFITYLRQEYQKQYDSSGDISHE